MYWCVFVIFVRNNINDKPTAKFDKAIYSLVSPHEPHMR